MIMQNGLERGKDMSGYLDERSWQRRELAINIILEPEPMKRFVVTAVDIAIDKMMQSVYLKPRKK